MIAYIILLMIVCLDFAIEFLLAKKGVLSETNEQNSIGKKILKFCFKYRVISFVALVFLSTFRHSSVGKDTLMYKNHYESLIENRSWLFNAWGGGEQSVFEFGFYWFASLFALISLPFEVELFVISVFVTLAIITLCNKISTNKLMSMLLYIALGVFAQSLNNLRQIIAIAFVIFAIVKLIDKKWIWALILIVIASTFHMSALVGLVLIPLRYLKPNIWVVSIAFGITLIGSFAFPHVLKFIEDVTPLDYYTKYFVNLTEFLNVSNLINILYSVGLIGIFIVFFIGRYKILKLDENDKKIYDYLLLIYLMVPLTRIIGMIVKIPELLNRVSMYFFVSLILLIPLFVKGLKYNKKLFTVSNIMVYIVAFGYMYYLYVVELSCAVYPYIINF